MSLRRSAVCARGASSLGKSRAGFTLIELLVVLAIILLLISILLPALAGAKQAARSAACLSNERQVLTALGSYLNTYRDVVPREGSHDPDPRFTRLHLSWAVALRPFLDDRVEDGADLNDLFDVAPYYTDPGRRKDGHRIHFMANALPFLTANEVDPSPISLGDYRYRRGPTSLSRLHFPESTAYLGEFADDSSGQILGLINNLGATDTERAQYYDVWAAEHILDGPNQRIATTRHGRSGNAAYVDGHARSVESRVLSSLEIWDDRDYGTRRSGN